MGLQRYATKELFLHLFYPTIVVIMTVIQIQLFHNKYMAAMAFVTRNPKHFLYASLQTHNAFDRLLMQSFVLRSMEGPTVFKSNDFTANDSGSRYLPTTIRVTAKSIPTCLHRMCKNYRGIIEVVLLLIEMHMTKVMCIYAFYLTVVDINAAHLAIVVLTMFATMCRRRWQVKLCALMSLMMGVLIILKMIYQMHNIQTEWLSSHCPVSSNLRLYRHRDDHADIHFAVGYLVVSGQLQMAGTDQTEYTTSIL